MASTVLMVSFKDSPLLRLEPPAAKLITSADCARAERSKESRVRVEDSKKSVPTVKPCSAGTFLIVRVMTCAITSAVLNKAP